MDDLDLEGLLLALPGRSRYDFQTIYRAIDELLAYGLIGRADDARAELVALVDGLKRIAHPPN